MHCPITAHHVLRGFKLPHIEDTLAVLGIDEAGGCLTGPIPIVVQWPEAHGTVLAATQKEIFTAQGGHTFDSPRVTWKTLQADLVEAEVGILLAHTNLVLPVRQPVSAQAVGTPGKLSLQGIVFTPVTEAPNTHSRHGAQWPRTLGLRVWDLDAVSNQDTPKGPRVSIIPETAPTLRVPFRAGTRHAGLRVGWAASARAHAFQIQSCQLPDQLVVGDDLADDVTCVEVEKVPRSRMMASSC